MAYVLYLRAPSDTRHAIVMCKMPTRIKGNFKPKIYIVEHCIMFLQPIKYVEIHPSACAFGDPLGECIMGNNARVLSCIVSLTPIMHFASCITYYIFLPLHILVGNLLPKGCVWEELLHTSASQTTSTRLIKDGFGCWIHFPKWHLDCMLI